ncbi:MAG: hypothetical protein HYU67_04445 [Flavobacteriia bacterium]|nr:hypothetical protein [Flavobacteriia bacterium]
MQINSCKEEVNSSIQEVFNFLLDTRNFYNLLPNDKISNWEADEKYCSFKVQGGFVISFEQISFVEPKLIVLKSGKKAPFPFQILIHLKETENGTEGYFEFNGEISLFLKIMVEQPLKNLFDHMAKEMKTIFSKKEN